MAQRRKRTTSVKKPNTSGDKKPLNWKKIALYGGLGLVGAIVVAIVIAVIVIVSALNNWGGGDEDVKEFDISQEFTAKTECEYVFLEYEEYFTQEAKTEIVVHNADNDYTMRSYYETYDQHGVRIDFLSGYYNGDLTPNELEQAQYNILLSQYGYTPELIAECAFKLYTPVECVRFSVTSMVFSDDTAVICLNTCDLDGTNPAQLTLTGAYTVADDERAITFTFADVTAFGKMFETAKYSVYKDYNTDTWYHQVTFASVITLYHN